MKTEAEIRTAIEIHERLIEEGEQDIKGLTPQSEEYKAINDSIYQYQIELDTLKWVLN